MVAAERKNNWHWLSKQAAQRRRFGIFCAVAKGLEMARSRGSERYEGKGKGEIKVGELLHGDPSTPLRVTKM